MARVGRYELVRGTATSSTCTRSFTATGLDHHDDALAALERARAIARELGHVELELRAVLQQAWALEGLGRRAEAAALLASPLGGAPTPAQRVEIEQILARMALNEGRPSLARRHLEHLDQDGDWFTLVLRLDLAWAEGQEERVGELAQASLAAVRATGNRIDLCSACSAAAWIALRDGRVEQAGAFAREALTLTLRPPYRVVPLLVLFELDVRAGRIEAGERRLLEAHGSFWPRRSWQRGLLLGGLSRARALLGDAEAAEARYEEAEGLMRELAPVGNLAEFLVERAERLAAAGDVAGAQAKLDEAEAALVEPQYPLGRIAGLRALLAAQGPAGGPTPRGAEADRN